MNTNYPNAPNASNSPFFDNLQNVFGTPEPMTQPQFQDSVILEQIRDAHTAHTVHSVQPIWKIDKIDTNIVNPMHTSDSKSKSLPKSPSQKHKCSSWNTAKIGKIGNAEKWEKNILLMYSLCIVVIVFLLILLFIFLANFIQNCIYFCKLDKTNQSDDGLTMRKLKKSTKSKKPKIKK